MTCSPKSNQDIPSQEGCDQAQAFIVKASDFFVFITGSEKGKRSQSIAIGPVLGPSILTLS
jgi:hypothetical protein